MTLQYYSAKKCVDKIKFSAVILAFHSRLFKQQKPKKHQKSRAKY